MRREMRGESLRIIAALRLGARTIDLTFFIALLAPVVLLNPSVLAASIFAILLYAASDIGVPWYFGTTPGKAFFRIHVAKVDGEPLSLKDMTRRSFWVFSLGLACGVFALLPVTLGLSYRRLTEKGATLWDAWSDTDVRPI